MGKDIDDVEMAKMHSELGGDTAEQRDYLTESEKELLTAIDKAFDEEDNED